MHPGEGLPASQPTVRPCLSPGGPVAARHQPLARPDGGARGPQGYGGVVFTSSITGPRVTFPGHSHYSASKAGINGLIRAAALENAAYGITVNGVEPGNILTGGMKAHRSAEFIAGMERAVPLGRLGTPLAAAQACPSLASDEA